MAKKRIILVSGIGSSGKTTSIRRYLNLEGVFHLGSRPRDIAIVFPLRRRKILMGVASGGDNVTIIARNFNFFGQHPWAVIVCASKARGQTIRFVQRYAARSHASLVVIRTTRVGPDRRAQQNTQIARQIWNAI